MAKSTSAPVRNRRPATRSSVRPAEPDRGGTKTKTQRAETAAPAGEARRKTPARQRRTERVTDDIRAGAGRREEGLPTPPSSLNLSRRASAARSGRRELMERFRQHHSTDPVLAGGDVDADWEGAAHVGDEAAGGDNPTPDQQIVDDIGRAVGVEYQDTEELRSAEKVATRDKRRWELDPASAEDYEQRAKERKRRR